MLQVSRSTLQQVEKFKYHEVQGPSLLENIGGDKLSVICILLCISRKYIIIVVISMTLPSSFNRSTTFF